jgi:GT2 family glycosyltransferase
MLSPNSCVWVVTPPVLMESKSSKVAVAICTRNRGEDAFKAIQALRENPGNTPIFVIDQSTTEESKALLAQLEGITYIPTDTIGLSAARNIAIEAAHQAGFTFLVFTDDDCLVPRNYIEAMTAELAQDDSIALVYANVTAAQHNASLGAVPTYERTGRLWVRTLTQKKDAWGIGAAMAVRVSAMCKIGGFDTSLGAGARFPAGEDWDIALRALLFGYTVVETDTVSVLHYGFRSFSETAELNRRDGIGGGAAMGKLLRLRPREIAPLFFYAFWHFFFWPSFRLIFKGQKPRGIGLTLAFLQGAIQATRVPLSRETLCFK